MEPLHMNRLRDLLNRLRSGESERRIARDMNLSRTTVRKYRKLADSDGDLISLRDNKRFNALIKHPVNQ